MIHRGLIVPRSCLVRKKEISRMLPNLLLRSLDYRFGAGAAAH
jgi:hypothetical protein